MRSAFTSRSSTTVAVAGFALDPRTGFVATIETELNYQAP